MKSMYLSQIKAVSCKAAAKCSKRADSSRIVGGIRNVHLACQVDYIRIGEGGVSHVSLRPAESLGALARLDTRWHGCKTSIISGAGSKSEEEMVRTIARSLQQE
jgi:hypothetical protein